MNKYEWASRYGSLAVSLLSLIVAAVALYFSVQSQKSDLTYKEASIKPRLMWYTLGDDYSLNVESVGLGPAAIKGFGMRVDGKCIDTSQLAENNWETDTRKMRNALIEIFYSAIGPDVASTRKNGEDYLG